MVILVEKEESSWVGDTFKSYGERNAWLKAEGDTEKGIEINHQASDSRL